MRILIIHTAFIGDIVLSTPLVKKLKEVYPWSDITYVTTPAGASILRNNPNISEIIEYDKRGKHKGLKGIYQLGKRLKYENFNLVITPHRYLRSSVLSWLTGSPVRKGYKNAAASFLYTEKIPYDKKKHEVEKLLSFVSGKENKRYEIELYPNEQDVKKINEMLKEYEGKKLILLAPGSKWFTKKWPLEYFNEIIGQLKNREDIITGIIGGADELALNIVTGGNVVDFRGKTSLLELAELIKRSELVVTNDSSPIHIASAWKDVEILAIFGPTVKELGFFPWSKNSVIFETEGLPCRPCSLHGGDKCPQKHFKCMLDIKPEIVLNEILKIIERV
ncbi:glycosyltransferase family 9 protein [Fusobacterium ulcerans]|uniref:glycosyltransferase family 9 protein n=1 Tax=Fusobacterium ulcerans TaxID=861 RepID=UPI00164DD5B9|nr:glycosyltransferase family 9 protein [Fusobacterium ulcerans]HJH06177.1 glycosyltransferase family 9 protein [Fusobacterium ulcerans]